MRCTVHASATSVRRANADTFKSSINSFTYHTSKCTSRISICQAPLSHPKSLSAEDARLTISILLDYSAESLLKSLATYLELHFFPLRTPYHAALASLVARQSQLPTIAWMILTNSKRNKSSASIGQRILLDVSFYGGLLWGGDFASEKIRDIITAKPHNRASTQSRQRTLEDAQTIARSGFIAERVGRLKGLERYPCFLAYSLRQEPGGGDGETGEEGADRAASGTYCGWTRVRQNTCKLCCVACEHTWGGVVVR